MDRLNTICIWVLVVCLSASIGIAHTQTTSSQVNEPLRIYKELIERVKKGDQTVDYVALISASSDLDLSNSTATRSPNRDEMVAAFKSKDYEKAARLAEIVLDYEFTNRALHKAVEKAYSELKNAERANFHRDVADRLMSALLSTGDGKSAATAYCVQGINEEYMIMQHFGYKVQSQALLMSGESSYDVLEGFDEKTKRTVALHFDISGHFSRCVRSHRKN
jgi:hypothetical protein